jgi:hypothetical protein
MEPKIDPAAATPLLRLSEADERLATHGVGSRLTPVGAPSIAARGLPRPAAPRGARASSRMENPALLIRSL